MSWFSSTQLSSFAKQALTTAQKSIDRVLDIKEDERGDTVVMPYGALPGKMPLSGGWGLTQWESPPEKCATTLPLSSEAITTPVTHTVVDETENFFNAFLPPGELQGVMNTQIVSVPPTKSHRRLQEKDEENRETMVKNHVDPHKPGMKETTDWKTRKLMRTRLEAPSPKSVDRQSTSTTIDIEVLDHESVQSESSASSRQETAEAKAGLHLMQGSFQLLSASACGDFSRLEDYAKLTERCGSSSNAFDRIDSFSMQSLDSRSVSEVNSDDEIPGSRTLTSVTAGPMPSPPVIVANPHSCLERRELQLLSISKGKARLEEECDNLKDEVIGLKEESSSVQSLKEEFTQRIADTERKAQLACKERDIAKKEIKGVREELSTRLNSNETMEIIREKEKQIRGLLEEGEKLSKQQLQHSNIIKKLRVKEKESETKITKQNKMLKEQEDELKHLQQLFDGKEEVEKQHRDNIKKLNIVVERQEKDMTKLQNDSEELQENNKSLQAALDNSYKELAGLHKAKASHASEAQEAALSRETQAKEELALTLVEARMQQDALVNQVADLQLALQRAEQQQARKEDYLREEISDLQLVGDTHTGLFSSLLLWS
uniref:TATA element modulatory factor 1 n=1 Tax=Salmo trutta TaxID=8032 RepID=A0A673ZIY2_SALTR